MKIAITGHTAGIGQALAREYEKRGHTIVGISKREGNDIRSIYRTVDLIEPCDMFINNAQQDFAQTDLLFELHKRWKNQHKEVIVLSTMMTMFGPISYELIPYYTQKVALENATLELAQTSFWPKFRLVRPGEVNTGPHSGPQASDVNVWAKTFVDILEVIPPGLRIYDFSLGVDYNEQ